MLKKYLVAGLALLVTAYPVSSAHAVSGAVEAAPAGVVEPPVVQRDNKSLAGFYLAGRQAGISKDLSSAAGFYSAALGEDPENPQLLDRSVLLNIASGNIKKAVELAEPLLVIDPNDQLALLALSVGKFRDGEVDEALAHMRRLKTLGGPLQELVGSLLEAWAMTEAGQPAQAIRVLDAVSGPSWMDGFTKVHAGLIADQAGLLQISEDRLRLAHEQEQSDIRLVEAYARTLARAGKTDRAKAVVDSFSRRMGAPDSITAPLRADLEGDEVSPHVETPRAGMAEALYALGRGIGNNDNTLAASLLQLALHLTPQSDYPLVALGAVLEGMRQHQAAIELYSRLPADAPLRREAMMQQALNLNILKRHDEAIVILERLVEEEPTDTATTIALGNVHRSLEQFDKAAEVYSASIDTLGQVPAPFWTLHYYRGISYERTDRWPLAEKEFRRALELSPEHPLVLNYLGYSYIDRGENLDEALQMVRRAVEQRPEDGYIVDSLGWAYYRLGRFEEAVAELEKAVSLRPSDPVINDHLGDAYWKVGRKLEAMFQWAHARDAEPEADDLKIILEKLEVGLDEVEARKAATEAAQVEPEEGAEQPTAQ